MFFYRRCKTVQKKIFQTSRCSHIERNNVLLGSSFSDERRKSLWFFSWAAMMWPWWTASNDHVAMMMDRQKWSASGTPFCKWFGSHEGIQQHTVLCIYIVFTIETHVYKHDISVYMHPSSCKSFRSFPKKQFIYHIICFQQGSISCLISTFLNATWAVVVFAGRFSRQRWIWRGSRRILNRQINSVGGITCEVFCCRRFEVRGSTAVFYIVCLHSIYKLLYVNIYIYTHLYADFWDNFFCNM